jgi:CMP-N,N'-diacetyllegionaminic acid synthase
MTRLLGFIPARSGSVRLPGKNTLEIGGKSLIERTVETALQSTTLDEIALSTDSAEYADIAIAAGLPTTYKRPTHLNKSETTSIDVVLDYLAWRRDQGMEEISHVLVLQPTSPQRRVEDIDGAVKTWRKSEESSLVSVMPAGPNAGYVVVENTSTGKLTGGAEAVDGNIYVLDGMFFLASVDMLVRESVFWNADSALYINVYPRPYDIDTGGDFSAARCMIEGNVFDVSHEPSTSHPGRGTTS